MEKIMFVVIAFDFIFFLIALYIGWTSMIDIWERLSPAIKNDLVFGSAVDNYAFDDFIPRKVQIRYFASHIAMTVVLILTLVVASYFQWKGWFVIFPILLFAAVYAVISDYRRFKRKPSEYK